MTLKLAIEEAIYEFAPDVAALDVEGVVAQSPLSGLVQLEQAPGKNRTAGDGNGWEEVNGLAAVANGAARSIEVSGHSMPAFQ